MPTYKLTIEYEGTRYSGWQAQGNTQKTIQGHLLRAAGDVLGDEPLYRRAGVVDAGRAAAAGEVEAAVRVGLAGDPAPRAAQAARGGREAGRLQRDRRERGGVDAVREAAVRLARAQQLGDEVAIGDIGRRQPGGGEDEDRP